MNQSSEKRAVTTETAAKLGLGAALLCWASASGAMLTIPNHSFESPTVPPESPYALPLVDVWQKTPQPSWYDPSQNQDTPWDYLVGTFYNVPFPGQQIENLDGTQAAFLFAVPQAGVFQDQSSGNTNALAARFNVGSSYRLAASVLGGSGGMQPGATLELQLYYRDDDSNMVRVAWTTVTNSVELFPTNTQFLDFEAQLATVQAEDAWAGRNIGIQVLSTVGFELAAGYWDVDNVRLEEITPAALALSSPVLAEGRFSFVITSQPGTRFEILVSPDTESNWTSLGSYTNSTGSLLIEDSPPAGNQRFYRARVL